MAGEGTLGSLVVSITTDLSAMNAGLKEAEKKVTATSGKITELTNKIGVAMTAAGAAITGAFALMVKSSLDYSEQIFEVSQRTGVAVETLSELKYVAEQTESSFEAVAYSLKFLNRNIYEATNGNFKMNQSFEDLGITLKDEVTGQIMKADEAFFRIADRFAELENGSAKTALAIQVFGRGGEAIIPVLNLGSERIRELSERAKELGIVLTTANAKALDEFGDNMKTLQASMSGLWLNITQLITPSLDSLVRKLTDVVVKVRQWSEENPQLSKFLSESTLKVGALLMVLGPLVLAFNQLAKAMLYLNFLFPTLLLNMTKFGAVGAAAITGFSIGRVLSEVTGLDEALSGKNGLFTHMFEWLGKNEEKAKSFARTWLAIQTLGLSELFRGKGTPAAPASSVDLGTVAVKKPAEDMDGTINLVERHAAKIKELNEQYLIGKMSAEEYYTAINTLHADGLDIKQQELDMLNQAIEAERLATDAEYQKIFVMNQGIQTAQAYYQQKAQLENQDLINQQTSLASATNLLKTLQTMHVTIWSGIFDFINMGIQKFSTGFSTAISSIILRTKTAGEAFKEFGAMMIQSVVEFVVQWAVQALIAATIGSWLTAAVSAQASVLAAAWMTPAILASIATYGGAAAAGSLGVAMALASGAGMVAISQAAPIGVSGYAGAEGGSGIVTRPTLFLAGEAGPEMFNFTPLDKPGKGGGNTYTINIDIDSPRIANDTDIDTLAEQLGDKINQELKKI